MRKSIQRHESTLYNVTGRLASELGDETNAAGVMIK
jgi:hypothetical protein